MNAGLVDSSVAQPERYESQEFRNTLKKLAHHFAGGMLETERIHAELRNAALAAWSGTAAVARLSFGSA